MSAGGDLLLGQEDVPRLKATVMSGRLVESPSNHGSSLAPSLCPLR